MKWKFCEKEFKLYPVLEGGGEIEKKGARELYLECAHKLFLDQPNLIGLDEYNELRKIGDGGLSGVLGQGLKMFFRQSIRCVTEVEMDLTELCLDFSKQTVCKDKAEVDMSKLQSQIEQLSKFSSSIGSTSLQLISTDLLSCCDDENLEKFYKFVRTFKKTLMSAKAELKSFLKLERDIVAAGEVLPNW